MIDLEIKDLKKSFGSEFILKGLSFSVNSQSFLALKEGEISFLKASKAIDPTELIEQYDSSVRNV